jgi:hypothetical protein
MVHNLSNTATLVLNDDVTLENSIVHRHIAVA